MRIKPPKAHPSMLTACAPKSAAWAEVRKATSIAKDAEGLASAWALALGKVEEELLARCDIGPDERAA